MSSKPLSHSLVVAFLAQTVENRHLDNAVGLIRKVAFYQPIPCPRWESPSGIDILEVMPTSSSDDGYLHGVRAPGRRPQKH